MANIKFNFKTIFHPENTLPLVCMLVGVVVGLSRDDITIRLIGLCLIILGVVVLIFKISQRMSETFDTKYKPQSTPEFKITVKKESGAKHQVIENFEDSFVSQEESFTGEQVFAENTINTDEGFKVVKKSPINELMNKEIEEEIKSNTLKTQTISEQNPLVSFEDTFSGFRIIPKKTEIPAVEKIDEVQEEIKPFEEINSNMTSDIENTHQKSINESVNSISINIEMPKTDILEDLIEEELNNFEENHINSNGEYKSKLIEEHILNLLEELPIPEDEPRKEFEYFVSRILMAIRSVTHTRSALFVLANYDKDEMIIESFVTDVPKSIKPESRIAFSSDIISQIISNQKPEILTEINPSAELDLLPYYTEYVGAVSFIGMPVFYGGNLIGVLCADSILVDAYDSVTVGFMGHFTKIISGLLKSYTEKYDLIQESKTLNTIKYFQSISSGADINYTNVNKALVESISQLVECQSIGVVTYDESQGGWHINSISSVDDSASALLGLNVIIENSLSGQSIINNKSIIHQIQENENLIRVHPREVELKQGFFIAIPLKSSSSTFGSIFIEGKNELAMSKYDIEIVETLVNNAAFAIERIHFMDMIQNSALIDPNTGILNTPALQRKVYESLILANDLNVPISFCIIQIDKYASFSEGEYIERMQRVIHHVISHISSYVKDYDGLGYLDEDTFGVLLFNTDLNKAKIWAERLRNEIAISLLDIEGKKFTVTCSFGIADRNNVSSIEDLYNNASAALNRSVEKTNSVSIFS